MNIIQLDDKRAQIMSNAKVAVLHGGLLARKGEARPMPTFGQPTTTPHLAQQQQLEPVRTETARPEPQHRESDRQIPDGQKMDRQEPVMADWSAQSACINEESKCSVREPILDVGTAGSTKKKSRGKARTELHARLDIAAHTRLKIASARLGRSQQVIVAEAIDAYLDHIEIEELNGCGCMKNARG